MINNEKHLYKLIQIIEKSLTDVVCVHGEIYKVSKVGNSVVVYFKDGNVYKQPLVTKERTVAVLDALR